MRTPLASILMFIAASVLGASGQFLYKSGADTARGGVASYLANGRILGGVACYVGVMALFVAAFKKGGDPAVLYPVYASTFIIAAIIGAVAYGTAIKPINVVGMLLLVAGMYCMGR